MTTLTSDKPRRRLSIPAGSRTKRKPNKWGWLEISVPLVVVLGVWLFSLNAGIYYLPPASSTLEAFLDAWVFDRVFSDLFPSLSRLAVGLMLGAFIGGFLGIAFGSSATLFKMYSPIIEFLRALPAPAILPVLLLVMGPGTTSQIALITFGTIWPILLSTMDGVRSLDLTMRDTVRSLRVQPIERLWSITIPAASPHFFAGLKTSLSLGIILMVISEMVGGSNGMGYFVIEAQREFHMPAMWAGIILLGISGYVLNALFDIAERRAISWYHGLKAVEK